MQVRQAFLDWNFGRTVEIHGENHQGFRRPQVQLSGIDGDAEETPAPRESLTN